MEFLILTHQYPKEGNLYRNGFVHQRVKAYMDCGHNPVVWVMHEKQTKEVYFFDDVRVIEGNQEEFNKYVKETKVDRILIHFLLENMVDSLLNIDTNIPVIVWVHGFESLRWYHRLFNPLSVDAWRGLKIRKNYKQLQAFKRFNEENKLENLFYVFVSNWMKEIAEKDVKTKFIKSCIIPNYINTNLFEYKEKETEKRKKILLIRPFHNKKYANDIAVKAILELSKKSFFEDFEIEIYGSGAYFDKETRDLTSFPNVKIHNKFLTQEEISNTHKRFGIFLCPTRQDAQGVSMCEAMSSGLIPITSNNTAIPEFVTDLETGFLTENPRQIAEAILYLYDRPEVFKEMSKRTSISINEKCNYKETIEKELDKIVYL
ncbi:hypothetical protein BK735_07980 [Bacillus mycoides]|uniref:glycosyltransferase family 4 protein n=1 Tax=Bacillus mycoides TaxID=1405 RepID=UPI0001A044A7|nr:glycosyltransferase family 4 protein [Bacillus mycoides]AIW87108.1 glycosyl transferases group 1 family protein [Bacillus mycoides]EEL03484.1 hypothetical protein bcere0014_49590 [Bacillus cereus BDRD-ST196]OTY20205.1 hypothetical protein BK735_07980 [Bacillus mycoides]GAE40765.1 hypothetical protein BW1_040_00410 [Bacillus mycoides NBRC 101238 = DSM 11821]